MKPVINDKTLLPHQLNEKLELYEGYRYVRVGEAIVVDATPGYKPESQKHITLLYLFGSSTWDLNYEIITPTIVRGLDLDMGSIFRYGDGEFVLPMIEQFTGMGITDELIRVCREKTLETLTRVYGLTVEPKYNY